MTDMLVRGAPRRRGNMLAGVAASLLLAGVSHTALAADEYVQVPKAQWDAVMQRLESLEKQATANRHELESLRGAQNETQARVDAVAEGVPDDGRFEKLVKGGKTGVSLEISGQVNKGVLFADSGDEDGADEGRNVFVVDNDASSTRVRFVAKAKLDDENSFGAVIEVQHESNSTVDVNQDDDSNASNFASKDAFTRRKLEAYWDNKRIGRLTVGHGDTASNGTLEKDISGTSVAAGWSSVPTMAGGIGFRNTAGALTMTTIGDVFDNLDGRSRRERVRYDSPKFYGTRVATSYETGGNYDVALHHSGEWDLLGGVQVAAGAHYANGEQIGSTEFTQAGGSVSVLHVPTGLNVTGAYAEQWRSGTSRDPRFYYAKLGWQTDIVSYGKTAFAVDYAVSEDADSDNGEATAIGGYVVQNFDATATEVYVGVRNHSYELPGGGDFQDILAALVGVRQKF